MHEYVAAFLSRLATEARVSASTQNQALNALLFLARDVLGKVVGLVEAVVRAKPSLRVPVVLTPQEVSTTMIYTHVLNRGGLGVKSPADRLAL